MIRSIALWGLVAAGCGGPSAMEIREAREALYQVDRATLWKELVADIHEEFPSTKIVQEDERLGVVRSDWKTVQAYAGTDENGFNATGADKAERMLFRALMRIEPGGPPWSITIDGQAGHYRPELSALEVYKAGADDEPAWVAERIKVLRINLHRRLKQYAVAPIPHQ